MPFLEPKAAVEHVYDYVIIGGGTAGLTAATRLSEDPSISVLVLEAGEANLNDPNIINPHPVGLTFRNEKYDWNFVTTKQEHSNQRQIPWARGKGLGGSSAMNACCWIKPPKADLDVLEKLGNKGWDWVEFDKYIKKAERLHVPAKEETDKFPHNLTEQFHGSSGPVQIAITPHAYDLDSIFRQSLVNKGVSVIDDPHGGDITGTWVCPANINPNGWTRSYSVTAYLQPNLGRKNLFVVAGALVSRVLFSSENVGGLKTADRVEFFANGRVLSVKVRREVILSAGTINDPKILELSGIGAAHILEKINVTQEIVLPGVGENVQEHHHTAISYELDPALKNESPDLPPDAENELKLRAEWQARFREGSSSFAYLPLSTICPERVSAIIEKLEDEIKEKLHSTPQSSLHHQYEHQISILKDRTQPDCELMLMPAFRSRKSLPEPGKRYFTIIAFVSHPFSRGNIHAQSADPHLQPEIDPGYFNNGFDLTLLLEQSKYIREVVSAEPFKSAIVREIDPGPNVGSDDELREYIKDYHGTTWHTVGSCSMLPRDQGGVVDSQLKVYGTANIRVVDLAIIPLHVAAHPQTLAYAIGEKAADLIKLGYSTSGSGMGTPKPSL